MYFSGGFCERLLGFVFDIWLCPIDIKLNKQSVMCQVMRPTQGAPYAGHVDIRGKYHCVHVFYYPFDCRLPMDTAEMHVASCSDALGWLSYFAGSISCCALKCEEVVLDIYLPPGTCSEQCS